MGKYFSCEEKQILGTLHNNLIFFLMNMEFATNFEVGKLGYHIVDL